VHSKEAIKNKDQKLSEPVQKESKVMADAREDGIDFIPKGSFEIIPS
jgi:hypothetical protein